MRLGVAAMVATCLLLSCAPGGSTGSSPSPSSQPSPATTGALSAYYGSYRTDDGDTVVVARLGWFFDMRDGAYRTIYSTDSPNRFTIGFSFLEPTPTFAVLRFSPGALSIAERSLNRAARRIDYRQTDVGIPAPGALLAGTITEPSGPGPHPGIVVVHGAEPGERYFYDVWVGIYAGLGLAVMTYDKRGVGASGGSYPGEIPTAAALATYADDAAAALAYLARWPGVDPERVGFHGGSQGGWTVPLAIQRHPGAAFDVLASASATTVDQTDTWAGLTGGGAEKPAEPDAKMLAEVRGIHSGYDPLGALAALTIPTLWLLGTYDRTVPTTICLEILTALAKPNFTVETLPTGHGLLVNPTGLLADDARSTGLAPELVPDITRWVAANMIAP